MMVASSSTSAEATSRLKCGLWANTSCRLRRGMGESVGLLPPRLCSERVDRLPAAGMRASRPLAGSTAETHRLCGNPPACGARWALFTRFRVVVRDRTQALRAGDFLAQRAGDFLAQHGR